MLIELSGITKTYKTGSKTGETALKNINLNIEKGEMVAVKGPSGAGKSTLLHIIGCLDEPTSGTYLLNGEEVFKKSNQYRAKLRNNVFGFVMQHFALIEEDSVLQNVAVPLIIAKTPYKQIEGIAMQQLNKFGVAHYAKKRAAKLSGGEKQRVAIARALVNDPDIILADEPTGAIDRENADIVMEEFLKLNQMGKTIIIVTHNDFVASMCRRTVTIDDGYII